METVLEAKNPDFERAVKDSFSHQGLMRQIGAWLVGVTPGRAVIELPFSSRLSQQSGFFHGAMVASVGDSAGGYAAMSLMPPDSEVVTIEYKVNFLRPAPGRLLRAEGAVIRHGEQLSVVRVDISCRDKEVMKPCAILQATMMQVDAALA